MIGIIRELVRLRLHVSLWRREMFTSHVFTQLLYTDVTTLSLVNRIEADMQQ